MSTELHLTLAETDKRVSRARSIKRWGMLSILAWPLGPLFGGLVVGAVCMAGAMAATLALITISAMVEANAKLEAARAHLPHQLPPARIVDR